MIFTTKWSTFYEAPVVEVTGACKSMIPIVIYNKKMSIEDDNGRELSDDHARRMVYSNLVANDLKSEKYGLGQNEIDVIIEFIMDSSNFSNFEQLLS